MSDSPTLAARSSATDSASTAPLPPTAAPPKPKTPGGSLLNSFFKNKVSAVPESAAKPGAKPAAKPTAKAAAKAPAKPAAKPAAVPVAKKPPTTGALACGAIKSLPENSPAWLSAVPADGTMAASVPTPDRWAPLSIQHREAEALLLPFVGYWRDGAKPTPCIAVTLTTAKGVFGGGAVFLVREDPALDNEPRVQKLNPRELEAACRCRLAAWSPGTPARADTRFCHLLWRLLVTFKGLEWELAHPRDIGAFFNAGDAGVDVFELAVPPPPEYVVRNLRELPCSLAVDDRKVHLDRCDAWSKTRIEWDTGSETRPPFWPVLPTDPRRAKIATRGDLVAAAIRVLHGPGVSGVADLAKLCAGDGLAGALVALSKIEARHSSPGGQMAAEDDDDDGEAAETAELMAPPKPKPKPESKPRPRKPSKQSKLSISGGSFVLGEASEGDPDSEEEGGSSEDGFIASEDDVDADEESAKKKAKVERAKNRERRHSVSGSGEEESDEEGSMSDGSGSDDGSSSGSNDEGDDPVVKAKGQASDGSDDDEERLVKRKATAATTAAPPRPKKRVRSCVLVEDEGDDENGDDEPFASRAALFAQQQITSEPTKGRPDGKMGSKLSPLHAKANSAALAPSTASADATTKALTPVQAQAPPPGPKPTASGVGSKRPPPATSKRETIAAKADMALTKVADLIAEAKEGKGNVLIHSDGPPLAAFEATTATARTNMAKFVADEGRLVDHVDKCMTSLVVVISRMADAIQLAQRKPSRVLENSHISIGATGSQMLLDILPTIETLHEDIGKLSKKSHAMALRLAAEQSSMLALERK